MSNSLKYALDFAFDEQEYVTNSYNGRKAYFSIRDPNADLYAAMGALRHREAEFIKYFNNALENNAHIAIANLFKLRDIKNGLGERDLFRAGLRELDKRVSRYSIDFVECVLFYGRADDLWCFDSQATLDTMAKYIADILTDKEPTLEKYKPYLYKWLPRKGKDKKTKYFLSCLRHHLKLLPKDYRKLLVENNFAIEPHLCNKDYSQIDYNHVPSQAMNKYRKTFIRNDEQRYFNWIEGLKTGNSKVNAGTLYPYQILNIRRVNEAEKDKPLADLLTQQWEALPNFFKGNKTNILPMIDVSGSMEEPVTGNTTALEVAISLGYYLAERNEGEFKHYYLTFSQDTQLNKLDPNKSLIENYRRLQNDNWGLNTNLDKAFEKILNLCLENQVASKDLPKYLIILSDMNFDKAVNETTLFSNAVSSCAFNDTIQDHWRKEYEKHGYKLPRIIYWNLVHNGTFTCTINELDVCELSGFSPSSIVDVLSSVNELTPYNIMLNAVKNYLHIRDTIDMMEPEKLVKIKAIKASKYKRYYNPLENRVRELEAKLASLS